MAIRKELIDELIAKSGGSLIGPDGLVKELTKALVEPMLAGAMNHHLAYEKHDCESNPQPVDRKPWHRRLWERQLAKRQESEDAEA